MNRCVNGANSDMNNKLRNATGILFIVTNFALFAYMNYYFPPYRTYVQTIYQMTRQMLVKLTYG